MSIEERITKLERRLMFYQLFAVAAVLGAAVTLTTAMFYGGKDVVKAKHFMLVNDDGVMLGEWKTDNSLPALKMKNLDGKRQITLSMLTDAQENTGLDISNNGDHAKLIVLNTNSGGTYYGQLNLGSVDNTAVISAGEDIAPTFNLSRGGNVSVRAVAQPSFSSVDVIFGSGKKSLSEP